MSTLYAAKVVPTEKVKKPRTEKQIAAFEKAKATRAKKAQEKKDLEEQEMVNKQVELEQAQIKLQELEEKKRIASEKRKATREAKRQLEQMEQEQEQDQDQVEESPKKKKKKQKVDEEAKSETTLVGSTTPKEDDTVPPIWFKKYIEGMAQTQNQLEGTKKAQKVIREEAKAVADEKWAQPNVRQQVVKQVENHVDRLYAQIFGGRRMTRV